MEPFDDMRYSPPQRQEQFFRERQEQSEIPALRTTSGLGQTARFLAEHPEQIPAALLSADSATRIAGVQALGRQGKQASLDLLLRALVDEDAGVRAAAARVLGLQEQRAPLDPLLTTLHDSDWRVRTAATLALGRLPKKTASAPLEALLQDEQAPVRAAAVWALGRLQQQAPIAQLVAALHDKDWSVREAAVMALQEQGERAPLDQLLAARMDEESAVRDAAEEALNYRYYAQQNGAKITPTEGSQQASPLLRLAVALVSVVVLLWPTDTVIRGSFNGRSALIADTIVMGIICLAIIVINTFFQQRYGSSANGAKPSPPWHSAVLAIFSVFILVGAGSQLFSGYGFYGEYDSNIIFYFMLFARVIALGFVAATIILINRFFYKK